MKYLFVADYADGTRYEQGPADESLQDPKRNAFFDIHYKPFKPEEELIRFSLVGDGHVYTVDLRDGHFEVDGVPFRVTQGPAENCRLLFWKDHTHTRSSGGVTTHEIVYRIGWDATVDGVPAQRFLAID